MVIAGTDVDKDYLLQNLRFLLFYFGASLMYRAAKCGSDGGFVV